MCKPKLYEKSECFTLSNGTESVIISWIDKDGKEHGARTCSGCDGAMFAGHVINDGEKYYCMNCINEHYTSNQLEEMYENETQYYTEWDESELMEDFELVYEKEENQQVSKSSR